MNAAPQAVAVSAIGRTRDAIQIASATKTKPKICFTRNSQAPERGNTRAPSTPNAINGSPMPNPSANSASDPRATSPVWPTNTSAAASGGVTQGPTISAEANPSSAAPPVDPLLPAVAASRAAQACGSRSSYSPNIDSASAANNALMARTAGGACNTVWRFSPDQATKIPSVP